MMKIACMMSALIVAVCVLTGCSGGDTEYVVRDGKVYCVFTGSEREFAVGIVQGEKVRTYDAYAGGVLMSAEEAETRILGIEVEGDEDHEAEEELVIQAFELPDE